MRPITATFLLLSATSCSTLPDTEASTAPFSTPQGLYLGVGVMQAELGDDFEGNTALVGAFDTILIPDADDGTGYALAVGARSGDSAYEMSWEQTTHDGSILSTPAETESSALAFDYRRFYRTESTVQPFWTLGFGLHWATLQDAASDGSSVGDADLFGFGLRGGGGVAMFLSDNLGLTLQALYRHVEFTTADGLVSSGSVDEGVDGSGLAFSLMANLYL